MRRPVSRIAVVVVFVTAIIGAALWFHGAGTTFAFADFAAPILKAKTIKYKMTTEMKGPHPMLTTSEIMGWTPIGRDWRRSCLTRRRT